MSKIEAIRQAIAEIGDVSAEELAVFVRSRYAVEVDPKFVPGILAMFREKECQAAFMRGRADAVACHHLPQLSGEGRS